MATRESRSMAGRPHGERREALFSILGALDGARVLDLYAGSGALGIEALSRGAQSAVFVERDAPTAAVIERNLASLGLGQPGVTKQQLVRAVAGAHEQLRVLGQPGHAQLRKPVLARAEDVPGTA